nr:isochorismatase family protein [Legionella jordanis]
MLLERNKSCLVLVDVQEKLAPLVKNAQYLMERCEWLLRLAADLNVPVLLSEQYPKGLGSTLEPLKNLIEGGPIEKVHFSCLREPFFAKKLKALSRTQIVLIGIETHVCVLQTGMDLKDEGYEVFVVVDAVSSRSELDIKYGLKRMKQAGIQLLSSEMVFFEWVEQAGTAEFKSLSKAYLK